MKSIKRVRFNDNVEVRYYDKDKLIMEDNMRNYSRNNRSNNTKKFLYFILIAIGILGIIKIIN